MSSDPKKPGFDAPPAGTPDLLQKDLSLDRRRRVPTFEELATDPMQKAIPRPASIPPGTVPARPSNLDEAQTQTVQKLAVPPGMQPRQPQPVMPIRTPTPPTQPARVAIPPPPPQAARPPPPPPARAAIPPPPPAGVAPPPPAPGANLPPARVAPPPPAQTAPPLAQTALRPPARVAPPTAAELAMTQPTRQAAPRVVQDQTGVLPARVEPPSPVEFAQARPHVPIPQVTPSVPTQGAFVPEGQPAQRASQAALKPAPLPAPVVHDEPEPLTVPAGTPARTFTPAPAPVPRPAPLPAEMLVTQPGLPGPFAHARGLPPHQSVPQRPPSVPEMPRVAPPESSGSPVFAQAQFEEALLPSGGDTVTAEPAALWRRLGAWLTDLLLVGSLVLGFLALAMAVIAPQNLTPLQQLMAVAVPGLALAGVLAFVYTTLFAFLWSGRTPGRRLLGIHLVDVTGHAPAPARALIRGILSLVSFGLFLSGFWLALFDRHGQTLHDKLTRTFVVKIQDA